MLYLALTFAGSVIATTIATEKATRISEVLLAVLRPSQILTGNVIAVAAVTLLQLLVLATPLAVSLAVSQTAALPTVAATDIAPAIAWFVLGFVLYAFIFAATAALVEKVADVSTAILPVTTMLILSYLVTVFIVIDNPINPLSTRLAVQTLTGLANRARGPTLLANGQTMNQFSVIALSTPPRCVVAGAAPVHLQRCDRNSRSAGVCHARPATVRLTKGQLDPDCGSLRGIPAGRTSTSFRPTM